MPNNKVFDIDEFEQACKQVKGDFTEETNSCIIRRGDTVTNIKVKDDIISLTDRNLFNQIIVQREVQRKFGGIEKIKLSMRNADYIHVDNYDDGEVMTFEREDASSIEIELTKGEDNEFITAILK